MCICVYILTYMNNSFEIGAEMASSVVVGVYDELLGPQYRTNVHSLSQSRVNWDNVLVDTQAWAIKCPKKSVYLLVFTM